MIFHSTKSLAIIDVNLTNCSINSSIFTLNYIIVLIVNCGFITISFNVIFEFIDRVLLKRSLIRFSFVTNFMVIVLRINLDKYHQEYYL